MTLPAMRANRRSIVKTSLAMAGAMAAGGTVNSLAQQGHAPNQATPAVDDSPIPTDDFGLTKLLTMVPKTRIAATNGLPYWYYADFERQMLSLGLHHDSNGVDLENEPASVATLALMPGSNAYSMALVEEFTEAIGFQPLGMRQNLSFGSPPEVINLFRGEFDSEAIVSVWEQAGYVAAETTSGTPAWTIGPEGEFEVNHPVQRYAIASMNNVAIIDDVLVYTNTLALLNIVLDHLAEGTPSVVDDEIFGPMLRTLPQSIVSSMGLAPIVEMPFDPLNPEQIEVIQGSLDAVREEVGPMPQMTAMIVAVDEGAVPLDFWDDLERPSPDATPDAGTMVVRLGMQSVEDAEQAVQVVVARAEELNSLQAGIPYSDLIVPVSQAVEGTTAMIDFTQLESPRIWSSLILANDVLIFVPDAEL